MIRIPLNKYTIILLIIVIFIGLLSTKNSPPDSDKLFSLINQWRTSKEFTPYIYRQDLCDLANLRTTDIANHDMSQSTFNSRIENFPPNVSIAENLLTYSTSDTEQSLLDAWLNKSKTQAILTEDYKYSCIQCNKGVCVEIFTN